MAAINFLNMAIDVSKIFLLAAEIFLGPLDHQYDKHKGQWNNTQRYQGHLPADGEHHDQNTNNGCHRGNNLGQTLVKCLVDRFNIIG